MKTLYYLVDSGDNGQGEPVYLELSKKDRVKATYREPLYFETYSQAYEYLDDIIKKDFDYNFSQSIYVKNKWIKPENLEISCDDFDIDWENDHVIYR